MLIAAAGALILVAGFLAGRAIGDSDNTTSFEGEVPTEISTRRSAVAVPILGKAEQIPTLAVPQPPAEAESEAEGESSSSPPPVEAETPATSPEPGPEVTVAPSG